MAPDMTTDGKGTGKRAVQFFSLTDVAEVAQAIRDADYFSEEQRPRPKGWFSFAGMTPQERDAKTYLSTDVDGTVNIGLRGRMWAITGLLGPLGAPQSQISKVVESIVAKGNFGTLVQNVTPDLKEGVKAENSENLLISRGKSTVEQLVSNRRINKKPEKLEEGLAQFFREKAPLTCDFTINEHNCILWAVDHVVEVACAAKSPLMNDDKASLEKKLHKVLFEETSDKPEEKSDKARTAHPYDCPAKLFLALAQAIGLHGTQDVSAEAGPESEAAPLTDDQLDDAPRSFIQPGLQQYAAKGSAHSRARDIDEAVATITRSLGAAEPTTRDCATLILLCGKEQSGKKSVIGDLLRSLRSGEGDTEDYRFPLRNPDGSRVADLPVFAVAAQRVHYRDLLIELFVFLNLHKPLEPREEPVIDETLRVEAAWMLDNKTSRRTLLEEIGRLHAYVPALFIFTDVHGFSRDGLQTMLVENGIYKLLDVLTGTRGASRFLITQEQEIFTDWERKPEAQKLRVLDLQMPRLDRFVWYPSEANVARYEGPEFDPLRARDQENPVELSGHGLLSMSALLALEPDTEEVVSAFSAYVLCSGDADEAESLEERHRKLNMRLLQSLGRRRIDDVILMIAATSLTDDSLSEPTLKRMIQKWRGVDDAALESVWPEICASLRNLDEGTQALFLNGQINAHVDREELSYREQLALLDSNRTPVVEWRMSRSVARLLLEHVRDMPNLDGTVRQVFRLLAQESHRRAQTKRARRAHADTSRLDIARDIQSLQALLASLPPNLKSRSDLETAPFGALRLRVEDVFGTDADHEPELVLRYAVLLLLRRDIDPDHMLSMVTDQDQLRLNLYIRLFLPLGKIHTFSVNDLRGQAALRMLPAEVPQHLFGSLRNCEIMELLLSIALAAFLSQLEEVVAWAQRLSESLMTDPIDPVCLAAYQRLRCVRFDAAILQGVAHSPAETASASKKGLHKVHKRVQLAWLAWHDAFVSSGSGPEDEILARVAKRFSNEQAKSARKSKPKDRSLAAPSGTARGGSLADGLRLLARAAELNWLVNDDLPLTKDSWRDSLYAAILALEDHVARQRGDAHRPVTLSGRTGRRMIRALTGDAMVLAYPDVDDPSGKAGFDETGERERAIRAIWHTNAARLGQQYAGAERLYTLLDYARVRASEDRLPIAASVLQDCVRALDDSLISTQGRLEILLADHACRVLLALRDWRLSNLAPSPKEVADHLSGLDWVRNRAEYHGLRPLVCESKLVAGRVQLLHSLTQPAQPANRFSRAKRWFQAAVRDAGAIGHKPAEKCATAWISYINTL